MRLLELKLNGKYSIHNVIDSLNKYSCSHINQNYYLFDYRDEIFEELERLFEIDLSNKYLSKKEIYYDICKE